MIKPSDDIQHLMFAVHCRVVTQFLQQIHQVKGKVVVKVLDGALKILTTDHLVHVLRDNLQVEDQVSSTSKHCLKRKKDQRSPGLIQRNEQAKWLIGIGT